MPPFHRSFPYMPQNPANWGPKTRHGRPPINHNQPTKTQKQQEQQPDKPAQDAAKAAAEDSKAQEEQEGKDGGDMPAEKKQKTG